MFDGIPVDSLTAPGLLLIAVLMLFLGWIVTKREHDDVKRQRDSWKALAEKQLENDETIIDLLRSIKRASESSQ